MKNEYVEIMSDYTTKGMAIPKGTILEVLSGGYAIYNGKQVDLDNRYRVDFKHRVFLK